MNQQRRRFGTRGGWIVATVSVAVCQVSSALAAPEVGKGRVAGDPDQAEQTPSAGPHGQAARPSRVGLDPPYLGSAVDPDDIADEPGEKEKPAPEIPTAVVIEVGGSVEWALPDVSVLAGEGWTPVKVEDHLEPGTQIRTGLRSHVNLRFGTTTFVSLRSITHASIDQFFRDATTESVRLGLAYGTIRGGSTEGEVRSDVTVESTVAALLKRGTDGWEMQVEPMTGRFRISLAEHGLVEAVQRLRSGRRVSRNVRPGEYATQGNIANMWIKQDIFDRNLTFYRSEAVTLADAEFTASNRRGFGTIAPGGGTDLVDLSGRVNADFVLDQIATNAPASTPASTALLERLPISRPEGNFGTGSIFRVLLPASSSTRSK